MLSFYPGTEKKSNLLKMKTKMLREWGRSDPSRQNYNVVNINVHMLEGLSRDPIRLESFLSRMIREYDGNKQA